jgi:hypothetical protein
MKKILLGCTFLTLMGAAFSQDIKFGIQAGTAIASQKQSKAEYRLPLTVKLVLQSE